MTRRGPPPPQVLIYVFDVESAETEKDMNHFMGVLEVSKRS